MTHTTTNDSETGRTRDDTIKQLDPSPSACRTRLDDLKARLDLVVTEATDTLAEKFHLARDAYRAARSSLSPAQEFGSRLAAVRIDVMRGLHDVKEAYDAGHEVVRRSHRE
jgi:hypothetical protein